MNRAFVFSLAVLALGASSAHASFELLLTVNLGSNSISRHDPENRVNLGSFGGNRLINPTAITIDQANNEAYISNRYGNGNTRITVMDYNTGEFKREWSLGAMAVQPEDIDFIPGYGLLVPNQTGVRRFSSSGSLLGTFSAPVTNIVSVEYTASFNEVTAFSFSGTSYTFDATTGVNVATTTGFANQRGFETSPSTPSFVFGGAGQNLVRYNAFNYTMADLGPVSGFSSIGASTRGHDSTLYLGGFSSGGQSLITTIDGSGLIVSSNWSIPGNGVLSMASVVAPEPGTMIALGVGLGLLAKRRRGHNKRSS